MSRIAEAFRRLRASRQVGLIAFLTVGYPDVESTLALVPALAAGGAHMVELGVPFSDPLADGATIQRASFHALHQGVTPATCLEVARQLRHRGLAIPLLFMGYYNPILAYGQEAFVAQAAGAGIDGLIAADVPAEEAEPLRRGCTAHGLDLISLLAPTSTDERIAAAAAKASGFIYCVSVTGITGARDRLPSEVGPLVARVRSHTELPIAVGFGISRHEHVAAVGDIADAAVIGSAIIDLIDRVPPQQRPEKVKEYVEVVTGRRRAET
ncbi:MAG: tryptophan synthase subunit alpha [Dehalococcoidia bacterium]